MERAARPSSERHRLVLDRREGDLAVVQLDGGRVADLPAWALPPDAREGDTLEVIATLEEGGARRLTLRVDRDATARATEAAAALLDRLRSGDPGGEAL